MRTTTYNPKAQTTEIASHTVGMLVVGGLVWLGYLAGVQLAVTFGISHYLAELAGMPLTWVANYWLNLRFNFRQQDSAKRFAKFVAVTSFGWSMFFIVSLVFDHSRLSSVAGAGAMTVSNLILQQVFTFNDRE